MHHHSALLNDVLITLELVTVSNLNLGVFVGPVTLGQFLARFLALDQTRWGGPGRGRGGSGGEIQFYSSTGPENSRKI